MEETFGTFLREKRKQREITVRAMAGLVGLACGSYCDIESGRRKPPSQKMLNKMIQILRLSDTDKEILYDLAGDARAAAPPDLPQYINDNQVVRVALRIAKEKATDDDWQRFINALSGRGQLKCWD